MVELHIDRDTYVCDERQPPLGAGAMGVVYRGHHVETGAPMAVKRVVDRYANIPEIRARAYQEADLMFRHPNLVEMLGCCEMTPGRGPLYIVSNYVRGENIDTFINLHVRRMPNVERRICELFMPVLDALAYIHSKGIIHMDIKPSNIMMENGRNVRLMDLGIADVGETLNVSTSGLMGTPKYAAPEQFADATERPMLTVATDIYEAGITLYELITGKNPFAANTIEEVRERHRKLTLPATHGLSRAVHEVIVKATAANPAERWQSATAMRAALMQAISTPQPTPWCWWKTALVAGIVMIMTCIVAMLIYW